MKIETERLILRSFEEKDIDDLYEYLKDISVHCFLDMKVNTLEETKKALMERINAKDEYYFAIELKQNHKVIGEVFAHGEDTGTSGSNIDTYSPCWILSKDYRGKGYMYEAVKAFYDYLFNEAGARRIYAYTEDYNIASQNLCKRLSMRQEGFYKEFVCFINDESGNPIYENTLEFAILKKEWTK